MPLIVDRWRLGGSQLPFRAGNAAMYGFAFLADYARAEELCERYLNHAGSPVKFKPPQVPPPALLPILPYAGKGEHAFVLITFVRIGELASRAPNYARVGVTSEAEATFWVCLTAEDEREKGQRTRWFVPYIFVDSPTAMTMGREVFGFPKEIGWFDEKGCGDWLVAAPGDGDHADAFAVDAFGVERFNGSSFKRQRLATVSRVEPGPPGDGGWQDFDDAAGQLQQGLLDVAGLIGNLANQVIETVKHPGTIMGLLQREPKELWPPHVTTILLKQLPSAASTGEASYQGLVEVKSTVTALRGGFWLGGTYELRINDLQSHPLAHDLGLADGTRGKGYWMDLDFDQEPGRIVWQR